MAQKQTGPKRLFNAVRYSVDGFKCAWQDEEAFRQIVCLSAVAFVVACLISRSLIEFIILLLPCVISMTVELLNTAVENCIDRISQERHPLSKKAKDLGSAAQFVSQCFIVVVWGCYLFSRLF